MMNIDRRALIGASGAALLLPGTALAQQAGERFSWDMVIARARSLARQPYRETPHHPGARKVDYDALYKAAFARTGRSGASFPAIRACSFSL